RVGLVRRQFGMRPLQITVSLGCVAIICMGAGYAVGRQRADVACEYDAVRLSVRASRPAPNKSNVSSPNDTCNLAPSVFSWTALDAGTNRQNPSTSGPVHR